MIWVVSVASCASFWRRMKVEGIHMIAKSIFMSMNSLAILICMLYNYQIAIFEKKSGYQTLAIHL
jgi:hypothetical protein